MIPNQNLHDCLIGSDFIECLNRYVPDSNGKIANLIGFPAIFQKLAQSEIPGEICGNHLKQFLSDSDYYIDDFEDSSVTIYKDDHFTCSIRVCYPYEASTRTLSSAPSDELISVLSPVKKLTGKCYELPSEIELSIFDPSAQLRFVRDIELSRGSEPFYSRAEKVPDLRCDKKIALLSFVESDFVPYQWAFDRRSLKPLFSGATRSEISRIETSLELLELLSGSHFDMNVVLPIVERLCEHPLHFVRWKALQTLSAMDKTKAKRILLLMRGDDHPLIAKTATKIVNRIEMRSN